MRANIDGMVSLRAFDSRPLATKGMQEFRQMLFDQILRTRRVQVQAAHDFRVDLSHLQHFERSRSQCPFPFGRLFAAPLIGVEKVSAGAQDAGDFRQKSRKIRITSGGVDVDDRIEGIRGKLKIFRVTLHEA